MAWSRLWKTNWCETGLNDFSIIERDKGCGTLILIFYCITCTTLVMNYSLVVTQWNKKSQKANTDILTCFERLTFCGLVCALKTIPDNFISIVPGTVWCCQDLFLKKKIPLMDTPKVTLPRFYGAFYLYRNIFTGHYTYINFSAFNINGDYFYKHVQWRLSYKHWLFSYHF